VSPWIVWIKLTGNDSVMDHAPSSVSRYSALHVESGDGLTTRCGVRIPSEDQTWGPLIRGEEALALRHSPFRGRCTRDNPTGVRHLKVCSKCDPLS